MRVIKISQELLYNSFLKSRNFSAIGQRPKFCFVILLETIIGLQVLETKIYGYSCSKASLLLRKSFEDAEAAEDAEAVEAVEATEAEG